MINIEYLFLGEHPAAMQHGNSGGTTAAVAVSLSLLTSSLLTGQLLRGVTR